ncbi:unnamed protein product [Rhizophagus irregularis]|nr:unnamed protein product [Rhizophagus irregularis]
MRSQSRLNPLQGTAKEKPTEEETVTRSIKQKQKETDKRKIKKTVKTITKRKIPVLAPVEKMVEPYTPQQLFDQPADISVGQLLAMNPKLRMATNKLLRKPIMRKKDEVQENKKEKMDVVEDFIEAPEVEEEEEEGVEEESEEDAEEENEEDVADETEEEYESESNENTQEQMFCNTQFVTQEEAQEIEESLREGSMVENNYFYQYKEIEKGTFHIGNLNDKQRQMFEDLMSKHQNLFAWDCL